MSSSFEIQRNEINALFTEYEIEQRNGNSTGVHEMRDRIITLFESIDFAKCRMPMLPGVSGSRSGWMNLIITAIVGFAEPC